MVHVLARRASQAEVKDMLSESESYIKVAVDIRLGLVAGGGAMHADCEAALLESGSKQEDIWGADWIPASDEVRFESLINIRPGQGNRSMTIEDARVRKRVEAAVRRVLGGGK
jgi:hypothetical protein